MVVGATLLVLLQRPVDEPADDIAAEAFAVSRQPSGEAEPLAQNNDAAPAMALPKAEGASGSSAMQRFADTRGITYAPQAQEVVNAFEALPDDPAWSSSTEVLLVEELARSTLPLADWYVECRRGQCLAILALGTVGQPRQGELPNRAVVSEQRRIADELQLLSLRAWRLTTRYDTLMTLLSFHRRCGPEWRCLE